MQRNPNAPEFALTMDSLEPYRYLKMLVIYPRGSRDRIVIEDPMLPVMTGSAIAEFARRCGILPSADAIWSTVFAIDSSPATSQRLLEIAQSEGDDELVEAISRHWLNRLDKYVAAAHSAL